MNIIKNSKHFLFLYLNIVFLLYSKYTYAESSNLNEVEQVIVTAQKIDERVIEIPMTVHVINSKDIKKNGINTAKDIVSMIPNLQTNAPLGEASGPSFSMRGVGLGNEFNLNQESPVSMYIDDTYRAARFLHGQQLYDIERIEVLKGPQGTLYGKNTTGGAVRILTRQPSLKNRNGYFTVETGNYSSKLFEGAFETTFIPEKFGTRISGRYSKRSPYLSNLSGSDRDSAEHEAIRAVFRYSPYNKLDVRLSASSNDTNGEQTCAIPIGSSANGTDALGYKRPEIDFYSADCNFDEKYLVNSNSLSFSASYSEDSMKIKWISGFSNGDIEINNDADGSPNSLLENTFRTGTKEYTHELEFSTSTELITWVSGLYYSSNVFDTNNRYRSFFALEGVAEFDPTLQSSGFYVDTLYDQDRSNKAIYSQLSYKFSKLHTLTIGSRYTKDDIIYKNAQTFAGDYDFTPLLNLVPGPGPYNPTVKLDDQEGTEEFVSSRLAYNYKMSYNASFFVSASRGFRGGAFNGTVLSQDALSYVQPEVINAYELGVKFELYQLQGLITGFYNNYDNQQIQEVIGITPFLRNSGESSIKGVETDITFTTDKIKLNLGAGFQSSEYKELTLSGIDLSGNEMISAPRYNFDIAVDWKPFSYDDNFLLIHMNAVYSSRQWFSPFNDKNGNSNLQQGAYWLLNGSISWHNPNYILSLFINNALDEEYFVYGMNLRDSFGLDDMIPGSPRIFGMSLKYDF